MNDIPKDWIARPDGSYVDPQRLEPRKKLQHELVWSLFPDVEALDKALTCLKTHTITEMRAFREMMLRDCGVTVGGAEGGMSLRSVCGTRLVKLEVQKQTSFGPELEAAKALLDEFIDSELDGSSDTIRVLVTDVFKLNSKGRLDTAGILGLRKHPFKAAKWLQAMDAIEEAIVRDSATTYVRFYHVNPKTKVERMVPLSMAAAQIQTAKD